MMEGDDEKRGKIIEQTFKHLQHCYFFGSIIYNEQILVVCFSFSSIFHLFIDFFTFFFRDFSSRENVSLCSAWRLKRDETLWKFPIPLDVRARFQCHEGCFPAPLFRDEKCEKRGRKIFRFRLLFPSAFSLRCVISVFH